MLRKRFSPAPHPDPHRRCGRPAARAPIARKPCGFTLLAREKDVGGRPAAGSEWGFTLVELMVVLAIVGLLGAAVLLTAPSPGNALLRDADGLGARLLRAQQEAVLGARAVRVEVDAHGYAFAVQRYDDWRRLDDAPFEPATWTEGVRPQFRGEAAAMAFRFDPIGTAEPAELVLVRDGRRARVVVDAAGEVRIDAVR